MARSARVLSRRKASPGASWSWFYSFWWIVQQSLSVPFSAIPADSKSLQVWWEPARRPQRRPQTSRTRPSSPCGARCASGWPRGPTACTSREWPDSSTFRCGHSTLAYPGFQRFFARRNHGRWGAGGDSTPAPRRPWFRPQLSESQKSLEPRVKLVRLSRHVCTRKQPAGGLREMFKCPYSWLVGRDTLNCSPVGRVGQSSNRLIQDLAEWCVTISEPANCINWNENNSGPFGHL